MKFIIALLLFASVAQAQVAISPNMNLPVPIAGVTPGPAWAQAINSSFSAIDSHNHSFGQGVQIQPNGLDINADLPFGGNNATLLRTTRFSPQASPITNTGVDVGELYVSGNELYYNDVSGGNQVKITSSGSVNATTSGISSGTASASFSSGNLVILSNVNVPAPTKQGAVEMSNASSYPNFVTLQPPASIASAYSITLPTIPGSQSFVTLDSSGNLAAPIAYPLPTAGIASGAVTATQIANGTITTTQISPTAAITGSQLSSSANIVSGQLSITAGINPGQNDSINTSYYGQSSAVTFTGSSSSFATVTSLTAGTPSFTGNRPTLISFYGYFSNNAGAQLNIRVIGTNGSSSAIICSFSQNVTGILPASVFNCIDLQNGGNAHVGTPYSTYSVQYQVTGGGNVVFTGVVMSVVQD